MPAPSQLAIAAQSVQRLVKEEAYYHKELADQQARADRTEAGVKAGTSEHGGNAEYVLKQERQAVEETKAVFAPLRRRIADAVQKLEEQVAIGEGGGGADPAELEKAREALARGREVVGEDE